MDESVFRAFCLGIEELSVGQMRDLRQMLRTLDARIEILAEIDKRRESIDICLYCGDVEIQRWGETRIGLQRFRCKGCGRTLLVRDRHRSRAGAAALSTRWSRIC